MNEVSVVEVGLIKSFFFSFLLSFYMKVTPTFPCYPVRLWYDMTGNVLRHRAQDQLVVHNSLCKYITLLSNTGTCSKFYFSFGGCICIFSISEKYGMIKNQPLLFEHESQKDEKNNSWQT